MLRDDSHPGFSSSVADRREATRHDATGDPTLMVARVIGASDVRLLDISRRGVLLETQTRLQFGVKATIQFTTCDASISVRALVVRSRVAGLGECVVYHTALAFDEELRLVDVLANQSPAVASAPIEFIDALEASHASELDADLSFVRDGSTSDDHGEILLTEAVNLLVTVDGDLETLQRRANAHGEA